MKVKLLILWLLTVGTVRAAGSLENRERIDSTSGTYNYYIGKGRNAVHASDVDSEKVIIALADYYDYRMWTDHGQTYVTGTWSPAPYLFDYHNHSYARGDTVYNMCNRAGTLSLLRLYRHLFTGSSFTFIDSVDCDASGVEDDLASFAFIPGTDTAFAVERTGSTTPTWRLSADKCATWSYCTGDSTVGYTYSVGCRVECDDWIDRHAVTLTTYDLNEALYFQWFTTANGLSARELIYSSAYLARNFSDTEARDSAWCFAVSDTANPSHVITIFREKDGTLLVDTPYTASTQVTGDGRTGCSNFLCYSVWDGGLRLFYTTASGATGDGLAFREWNWSTMEWGSATDLTVSGATAIFNLTGTEKVPANHFARAYVACNRTPSAGGNVRELLTIADASATEYTGETEESSIVALRRRRAQNERLIQ